MTNLYIVLEKYIPERDQISRYFTTVYVVKERCPNPFERAPSLFSKISAFSVPTKTLADKLADQRAAAAIWEKLAPVQKAIFVRRCADVIGEMK